jgi:hypothetical protein
MRKVSLALASLTFLLWSCGDDESGKARFQIRMTDAPAAYDEVNIDIADIQINRSDSEANGWESIGNVSAGVYNLLELSAGIDTLLADVELPAGRVSQIRLILGDNNSLKIGDQVKPLSTPSAQQSGLKLNIQADLVAGVTYSFLLDFDAARSIVEAGNSGNYSLKPVIRVVTEATSGAISGVAVPAGSYPVYAFNSTDTVTAFSDEAGAFLLRGVPAGSFTVKVVPDTANVANELIIGVVENVSVSVGQLTEVGEVSLEND